MCGIVGYIGEEQAAPILLNGLQKLEYRGYDSAGVAVYNDSGVHVVKSKGRLSVLDGILQGGKELPGTVGIGHTRWATHGAPSDVNSHPQVSDGGLFAVVHNGIIENYLYLKNHLIRRGVEFVSDTDTEVVAQMLEYYYKGDVLETIQKVISKVEGSYALGIICADCPDRIFAVRKDSPLIIGIGEGENYIASDVPAILSRTRDIYRLKDQEIAVLTRDTIDFYNQELEPIQKEPERIQWDITAAEKGGYEHFMMKEICEQPEALRKTISPRIRGGKIVLDDITLTKEQIQDLRKVFIVACGTSYHVGVVAKYAFERLLKIPLEVDVASEFRYRDPILDDKTLVIIISPAHGQGQRLPDPLHCQCGGQHHRQRIGRRAVHLGWAGDCRGLHQGLQHPVGRHLYDCPVHGRPAGHRAGGRHGPVHGGFAAPSRLGGSCPGG